MAKKAPQNADAKPSHITFECSTFKQGKYDLVLFSASAKELYSIVTANQLNEDKEEGYQRVVSPSRQRRIAKYIDEGNPIPLSVLISFEEATLNEDKNKISVPNRPKAGWIIDGQHRLAGAHMATVELTVPVVAFIGIDNEEQVELFVTINREQTGVPSSLYYELLKQLPTKKTEKEIAEERAAEIARMLKRDEASPFFERIVSTTSPRKGQISTTQFVRKVAPYLRRESGCLWMYTDDEKVGILNNYYQAIAATQSSEYQRGDSIFFQTLGFGAMMNALPRFLETSLRYKKGFRVVDVVDLLKRIPEWDPASWRKMGTGTAAENRAADDLVELLRNLQDDDALKGKSIRL